ncbi:hypothetical protein D6779_11390 [Candidatus Parcubacteria bacterium]|nr:MAG: hypothetical protein D6779_11390 [Candidatus Parcubacteria bacterium]
MNSIRNWLNKPGNRTLFLGMVGFLVMVINLWISNVFNIPPSSPVNGVFIATVFVIWGFSGFVMAKEKVYPGFKTTRWIQPVFTGIFLMVIGWSIALYALWKVFLLIVGISNIR